MNTITIPVPKRHIIIALIFELIMLVYSSAPAIALGAGAVEPNTQWRMTLNGTNYDKVQMQAGLLKALDSSNKVLKLDWLFSVEGYAGERYFSSNTFTMLIYAYQSENDPGIRREIFEVIRNSHDKRYVEVCAIAQNDSDPWISKMAKGALAPATSFTFYEEDAKEIQLDGVKYNVQQAQTGLFLALDSTDSGLKQKWLRAISEFRTSLRPTVVPRLIQKFQTEREPKVRVDILHAIQASRDPKLVDVCLSAQNDTSALVRLIAGALLIAEKNIQGVDILTRCLPELDDQERQNALRSVGEAVSKFGLEFKPINIIKSPEPTHAELDAIISEWTKWWTENKQRYNPSK